MWLEVSTVTTLMRVITDWRRTEKGIRVAGYTDALSLTKFTGQYTNGIAIFFLCVYQGPKSQKVKEPVTFYQKPQLKS